VSQRAFFHCEVLIITWIRNESGNLPRLIDSVKQQTLRDWRWLIFDNASNDDSLMIITQLIGNDQRVHIYSSKTFLNVEKSFESAVRSALRDFKSTAVVFLGGDDTFGNETFLERAMLRINEGSDLVVPSHKLISASNQVVYGYDYCNGKFAKQKFLFSHAIRRDLGNIFYSLMSHRLFKTVFENRIQRNGYREDWWTIHRILLNAQKPYHDFGLLYNKFSFRNLDYSDTYYLGSSGVPKRQSKILSTRYYFQEDIRMLFSRPLRFEFHHFPLYILLYSLMLLYGLMRVIKVKLRK
jgi:glycosyltransferase involved in cell wall biosynthesis